jgi:hypothetical protein
MKLKDFTLGKCKSSFEVVSGTVNNKTAPTSKTIIAALSDVLFDMYQQKDERDTVESDE